MDNPHAAPTPRDSILLHMRHPIHRCRSGSSMLLISRPKHFARGHHEASSLTFTDASGPASCWRLTLGRLLQYMKFLGFSRPKEFVELAEKSKDAAEGSTVSFPQRFEALMKTLFPLGRSPIGNLYEEAFPIPQRGWTDKLQYFLDCLDPRKTFGQALLQNRDIRIPLNSLNLNQDQSIESLEGLGARRELGVITLPALQSFCAKLGNELACLKEPEYRLGWRENFQNDELYFYMVRNPLIYLIRLWLIHTRTLPAIFSRVLSALEWALLRVPMSRFRKGESVYLRAHHFHGLYLLVEWRCSKEAWEFMAFVADYLEIRQKNFNLVFCAWLRLHLVMNKCGFKEETEVRKALEEGLKGPWRRVRIRPNFSDFQEKVQGISNEAYREKLTEEVASLIGTGHWTPSPQLLAALLTSLLMFRNDQHFEGSSVHAQIATALGKFQASSKKKDEETKMVVGMIKELCPPIDLPSQEMQEDSPRPQRNSEKREKEGKKAERRSFVSYQREPSPWQVPLVWHQLHILYAFAYSLSAHIDKRNNRKAPYPTVNLRFLASGSWMLLIIVLYIMWYFLFR